MEPSPLQILQAKDANLASTVKCVRELCRAIAQRAREMDPLVAPIRLSQSSELRAIRGVDSAEIVVATRFENVAPRTRIQRLREGRGGNILGDQLTKESIDVGDKVITSIKLSEHLASVLAKETCEQHQPLVFTERRAIGRADPTRKLVEDAKRWVEPSLHPRPGRHRDDVVAQSTLPERKQIRNGREWRFRRCSAWREKTIRCRAKK